MAEKREPWKFLEKYRGTAFKGEWPTLPEMFKISVDRFANHDCFTIIEDKRETLTYAQVLDNVENLSQWFLSKGIQKGDRIAVSGKNSPEWATVYLGALFAGAIIVPIDYGLNLESAENLLRASGAKMLFTDEEKYEYAKSRVNKVGLYSLSKKYPDTYVYNLSTDQEFVAEKVEENDTAAILFTSGTTGNPKGVVLTHKNFVSDCYIAQTNLIINDKDVFYALLPIHHSYTMQAVFIESLSVGAEIVFGKSMAVSRMLKELKQGEITMLLGVPLLFNKLLAGIMKGIREKGLFVYGLIRALMGISYFITKVFHHNPGKKMFKAVLDKASLGSVRIAICGGGPLASSIFRGYQELGIDFIQGYGLTETSPIIALNPKEKFKIASVGRFFHPYMEMKIDNPDENGIGEVLVKGPMVMEGYYNMPEETEKMFTKDGWLKTGDLGSLDEEHYLYLSGRAKNLIVTEGGKNVFPEEIENEFQLEDDLEQVTIQGYVMDKATKSEGIEALIYVSDSLFDRLNIRRDDSSSQETVLKVVQNIVNKVNKDLKPYARITKITLLEEPLEMTTTRKVKRNYKK
ncbi:MAG: long-chain fatty acid--CoA ligase [Treponema sp. CETP13]|nr:MAG: long-chain fatty acid--CoA ligase [Treponema sp. CETP13]